jgi:capsular exopolysaccharide synthesis family protein
MATPSPRPPREVSAAEASPANDYAGPAFGDAPSPLGFDPYQLWAIFRRRLGLFTAVAVLIAGAVGLYVLQMTPQYSATANVLLAFQRSTPLETEAQATGVAQDTNSIDTQVQIITSRALAERVVRALNLQADEEFGGSPDAVAPPADTNEAPAARTLDSPQAASEASANATGRAATTSPLMDNVVNNVLGRLSARRAGLTYVIDITFESANPEKAATIANAFADAYIRDQLETKYNSVRVTNDWLTERLGTLRAEAEAADAALQRYRIANGLMSANGSTIAEQEVSGLNAQIAQAEAQSAERRAMLDAARGQVSAGGGGADVGAALSSSTIASLRQQEATVSREITELNAQYGPQHPRVIAASGNLRDIQQQIQQEINRNLSSLEAAARVADQRVASLRASQGVARGTLAANSQAQVGLMELERRAEASRQIYEAFLNRSKETSAQEGIQQADARIVSRARVPGWPSSPNMRLAVVFALGLAMFGGLGAVAAAEILDQGFRTSNEVEQRLGLPLAGSLPTLQSTVERADAKTYAKRPWDHLVDKPFSVFAESFRNLRAFLMLAGRHGTPPKVIAITSSLPGEGKTTAAFAMMRTLALSGASTVLVDCDVRRRALSEIIEAGPCGLLQVLSGECGIDEALRRDGKSGGFVLPVVERPLTANDPFSSEAMDTLIEGLLARFDFVVLDTPPLLAVADARILSAKADAVVFLVQWRRTPLKAAQAAVQILRDAGAWISGAALTQVNMRAQASYGYGDSSYYYNKIRKYYAS